MKTFCEIYPIDLLKSSNSVDLLKCKFPLSGSNNPKVMSIRVDFPEPLGPMIPIKFESFTYVHSVNRLY